MPKPLNYLLATLIGLACIAFLYGIARACIISLKKEPDISQMPSFLSSVVTSIAAIFATNLGAVLGITISNPQSILSRSENWIPFNITATNAPTAFQVTACYIYVVGLLAAAIVWARKNFSADPKAIIPLIPELTKSLLGVMIGALAISLNVPKQS